MTRFASGGIIRGSQVITLPKGCDYVIPDGVSGLLIPPRQPDCSTCPSRIEVTTLGEVEPRYVCGCGQCHKPPPPTCVCGDSGTHRPGPGIGCTRPGCLCLEPTEPTPRAARPLPNPGRSVRR